jgi:uncharacterized membrane protein
MNLADRPVREGVRLRGEEISRLETFVDAAFAFAVTMLVISVGTIPRTVDELFRALKCAPAFGLTFLIITIFWLGHNRWSRRYGLDGGYVTFLSLALVFVTLVFVYPLRTIISGAMHFFSGGYLPADIPFGSSGDMQDCFLAYGVGFTVQSAVLVELYRHTLKRAVEIELDPVELVETRREMAVYAVMVGAGILSMATTFLVRDSRNPFANAVPGLVYCVVGIAQAPLHRVFNQRRARAEGERAARRAA